jgi:hypothetical protein
MLKLLIYKIEFKIYLNEEIGRIKSIVLNSQEIKTSDNAPIVIEMVESFRTRQIDGKYLEDVLYLQVLAKEIEHGKD